MTPSSRPLLLASTAALVAVLTACSSVAPEPGAMGGTGGTGSAPAGQPGAAPTPTPTPTQRQLPQGGTTLFPTYRLFGYSGSEGTGPGLGRAGVGNIDERMTELVERSQPYTSDGRKAMPVLEYIATTVQPCKKAPKCRSVSSDERVQEHLDAVRKVNGILLLAIQPGRSDFPTEVKRYEKFLKEPDVGVALDPEWRMGPTQEPMETFGSTTGKELNDTALYLAGLVKQNKLPEKVMLYHMIRTDWVKNPGEFKGHPGLAQIVSVDGIGDRKSKIETWNAIMKVKPKQVHPGFKLFYQEDTKGGQALMTPAQVMALTPRPEYVLYE